MPVAFPGRVEALIKVPSGGASVSASNGAQSAATTVTVPAGSFFHTAAGGVSSLLTTLQTQLNNNVQGYPTTAAAMQAALGYGNWANCAIWLCNESSGNLVASAGSPNLTPVSSPTYGAAGPRASIDKAVGFDSANDAFSGANVFNVNGTDDLIVAWVGYAASATSTDLLGKWTGAAPGWLIVNEVTRIRLYCQEGANVAAADTNAFLFGEWYVALAYIDRGSGICGVVYKGLTSGLSGAGQATIIFGNLTNAAANFRIGDQSVYGSATSPLIAFTAIVTGTSVASTFHANRTAALDNFRNAINSSFTAALSTTDGRVTVSNSFWPSYCQFTNTTLRDLLGFAYDFDAPQTAAQLAVAAGQGAWTGGAGWLCNEGSGNLVPVFGSPSMVPGGGPTYSLQGPRGGADKAVAINGVASQYFDGGDVFDMGATDDLGIVAVVRFTSAPAGGDLIISKGNSATADRWLLFRNDDTIFFRVVYGGTTVNMVTGSFASIAAGDWFVIVAGVDRSTGMGRVSVSNLRGTVTATSALTAVAASSTANSDTLRFGTQAGYGAGVGAFQLAAAYVVTGSQLMSGVVANTPTTASNFATYMKSQTGTQQARGLWFPDCPMNIDDEPRTAPLETDSRSSQSPTGNVITYVGNSYFKHTNVVWERVPIERYRAASATYVNGSFEEFWSETQYGMGSSWFTPGSALQIYYDQAGVQTAVGSDEDVSGWFVIAGGGGIKSVARKADATWTGYWTITLPTIVSPG